jgi:hypothetical protein
MNDDEAEIHLSVEAWKKKGRSPMNCMVCGRETREADPELGPYCSQGHRAALLQEVERLHAEILPEPAGLMPEAFTSEDVDHVALKIALLILEDLPPEERMSSSRVAAVIRSEILAFVPPQCLARLPTAYASLFGAPEGHPFQAKIPRDVIREALKKAGYLEILE